MRDFDPKKDGTYGEWLEKYNNSGIREEMRPPDELVERVEKFDVVMSSDLKRALDSAHLLAGNKALMQNPVFREFELPETKKNLPRFTPGIWSFIFRVLWFFGYSNRSEHFTVAKERIKESAEKLTEIAEKYSDIVLVGHGLMNRFIGGELRKRGWKKRGKSGKNYWSFCEYKKSEVSSQK